MEVKFKIIIAALCCGILAVFVSVGFMSYALWEDYTAGKRAAAIRQMLNEHIPKKNNIAAPEEKLEESEESAEYTENTPSLSSNKNKMIEIDGEFYIGILSIPFLGLELPVNNELSDERLNNSPCRYVGNLSESITISAHNYKQHFGKLSTIPTGEKIIITDANGVEHLYKTEAVIVLNGNDVDAMINNPYDLTLFTCTPDSKSRTTVRCVKMK